MDLPIVLMSGAVAGTLAGLPLAAGATLAHKLPDLSLRRLFAIFLFIPACRMCLKLL